MMKNLVMLGVAAACLSLAACAGSPGGAPLQLGGAVADVTQFTDTDLDAALATAKQYPAVSPNQMVIQCIPSFKAWIDSLPGAHGVVEVKGLASGLETAILVQGTVQQGVPDSVYEACGPLYAKVHATLLKYLGGKALSVGTGGIF